MPLVKRFLVLVAPMTSNAAHTEQPRLTSEEIKAYQTQEKNLFSKVPASKQLIDITDRSRCSNIRTLSKHVRKKKENWKLWVWKSLFPAAVLWIQRGLRQ